MESSLPKKFIKRQLPPLRLASVSNRLRLLTLLLTISTLTACAATRTVEQITSFSPTIEEKEIERNQFKITAGDDVIGQLAVLKVEKGDTLPDIARHFGLGINALVAANQGVDVWVPKAGERITLPLSFVLPDAPRKGIVVNLAAMRLFRFKGAGKSLEVSTYPIGIGMKERPTPTGFMRVERKAERPTWYVPPSIYEDHRKKGDPLPSEVPPGPLNPLGEWALYLSKSGYLIHGTNKPASIGLEASNGCIRLYPENVETLFKETPVDTPVAIVNQPYLVGLHDGEAYLEAHAPLQGAEDEGLKKVYMKLKKMEKITGRKVDWKSVRTALTEARGVPVAVLAVSRGIETASAKAVEVKRPERLYGAPELPELKLEGWYVLAADVADELQARRIAAIINHQGPPIPARVLTSSNSFRVIAGPFGNSAEAKEAARRLKIDLEIEGILVEPVRKLESTAFPATGRAV